MSLSIEVLTQQFLESITAFTTLIPAARIAAMSLDRNYDLADGAVALHRETGHTPQLNIAGYSGLTLHSYAVTILAYDPDAASLAMSALKSRFRNTASWPWKPSGWTSGDRYIEGAELRDGNTDDAPEVVSDRIIVQKTIVLDIWFQE